MPVTDLRPEDDLLNKLFYDQFIRFESEFVEAAEKIGVSNEALERTATEMDAIGGGSAVAFAHFCRHVLMHRRISQLCAFMRPGEETVSLQELAARAKRQKGDA